MFVHSTKILLPKAESDKKHDKGYIPHSAGSSIYPPPSSAFIPGGNPVEGLLKKEFHSILLISSGHAPFI
jgi:hypothetical protein